MVILVVLAHFIALVRRSKVYRCGVSVQEVTVADQRYQIRDYKFRIWLAELNIGGSVNLVIPLA